MIVIVCATWVDQFQRIVHFARRMSELEHTVPSLYRVQSILFNAGIIFALITQSFPLRLGRLI